MPLPILIIFNKLNWYKQNVTVKFGEYWFIVRFWIIFRCNELQSKHQDRSLIGSNPNNKLEKGNYDNRSTDVK